MLPYLVILPLAVVLAGLGRGRQVVQMADRCAPQASESQPNTQPQALRPGLGLIGWCGMALLVGFSGFRYLIGTDYESYYWMYELRRDIPGPLSQGMTFGEALSAEILFDYLIRLLGFFGGDAQLFFTVASALAVGPIYFVVAKFSPLPALSIALYLGLGFYLTSFNTVRQSIAVGVTVLAFHLLRSSYWRFALLMLIAAGFHVSALLLVPFHVLAWIVRKRPSDVALWSILLGVGGALIVRQLAVVRSVLNGLNERYDSYLDSGSTGVGTYLSIAFLLGVAIYSLYSAKPSAASEDEKAWTVLVFMGLGLLIMGTQALVAVRLSSYLVIYIILLGPSRVAASASPGGHAVVLMALAFVYGVAYLLNYGELVPYQLYP